MDNKMTTMDNDPPPYKLDEMLDNEKTYVVGLRDPELRRMTADDDLFGLALSGGGIRSATFSLGILQALAQRKWIQKIDYLSTVSGGGYIGCWLSACISGARGKGATDPGQDSTDRIHSIEKIITPSPRPGDD